MAENKIKNPSRFMRNALPSLYGNAKRRKCGFCGR